MPIFQSIFKWGFSRFLATSKLRRLTILFAAALAIGAVFVFAFPSRIHLTVNTDYFTDYKPTAENILNARGVLGADGQLETRYPPAYPLYLVVAYKTGDVLHVDRERAVVFFNLITGAASTLLVYTTIDLLFGASIALLTWFLWATYIPGLVTFLHPNSEVPFMLFFFAAVCIYCLGVRRERVSAESGFFSGILLGAAALVRPIAVFLPFVFMASAVSFKLSADQPERRVYRREYKLAAAILLGFVLSIAPWEIFVRVKSGDFILLSTNGPATLSEGLIFGLTPAGSGGSQLSLTPRLQELMERANRERPGMRTDGAIVRFLWDESARNPWGVAELLLLKLRRSWYGTYSKSHEWPIIALQLPYLVFAVCGLVFWPRADRSSIALGRFLCGLVVYFWVMACLVVPLLRYVVPAMAWVMLFVGLAIHAMYKGWWTNPFRLRTSGKSTGTEQNDRRYPAVT